MNLRLGMSGKWLGLGLVTAMLGACSQVQRTADEQVAGVEESAGGTGGSGADEGSTVPTTSRDSRPKHFSREWYVSPSGSDGAKGSKHAATEAAGVKTSETRKAGPRKTPAKTTTRSGDK